MNRFRGVAALLLLTSASTICRASGDEPLKGSQAMGGWQSDKPGILRHLTPGDLPAISEDVQAYSRVVSRPDGAMPQVPAGFSVEMVNVPRVIRVAPNGDLFLAESGANRVRVLRPGSAYPLSTCLRGYNLPSISVLTLTPRLRVALGSQVIPSIGNYSTPTATLALRPPASQRQSVKWDG
jgi:hypothetical protein